MWNTQRLMSGGDTQAQSPFKNKHPTYRQLVAVKTVYMYIVKVAYLHPKVGADVILALDNELCVTS